MCLRPRALKRNALKTRNDYSRSAFLSPVTGYSTFMQKAESPCSPFMSSPLTYTLEREFDEEAIVLNWVITFFLLAVIAAVFGFGGLAGTFAEIAKFLAVIFVILFIATLIYSTVTGRRSTPPIP